MNAQVTPETPQQAACRISKAKLRQGYKLTALYQYNNADGSVWCYRIRCDHPGRDKWMRPMWFDGDKHVIDEPPAPVIGKPLYRLRELLTADPVALVWVVEGEKCADTLAALGLIVVTCGGATSVEATDWSPLRGRKVRAWPDHDDAGVKCAAEVMAKLGALSVPMDLLDVAALNLPDKGDCVNWLALHPDATATDVLALPLMAANTATVSMETNCPRTGELISTALSNLGADPGALFEKDVLDELRLVRQADPAEYARIRAKAKQSQCSVVELDRLSLPVRITEYDDDEDDAEEQVFEDVEPWPEPVDGAELLTDLCMVLRRHVVADEPTITAAALWTIHTWCMDVLTASPLAHITAPEKRCGKTVLLTALARLTYRPLPVSNISSAALFRSVEAWGPTLLIDEVDSFLLHNDEARGLINSGLYRETAFVLRCDGEEHTPKKFSTWGAKVLCGIGKLADTIEDRSIPLRLRRKVKGEHTENIRRSEPTLWGDLQSQIARWTTDNKYRVGTAHPDPVIGLNDRAQDCWEPLLAIADLAGGRWPQEARNAAVALHGVEDEAPSTGVELLADIKDVFDHMKVSRLSSRDLLAELVDDVEAPWATWNRGKQMTARQLATRLKDFGIRPAATRLPDGDRLKGYRLNDFADAFDRYLASEGGYNRDSVTMASQLAVPGIAIRDSHEDVTDTKPLQTAPDKGCHAVTDESTHGVEQVDGSALETIEL